MITTAVKAEDDYNFHFLLRRRGGTLRRAAAALNCAVGTQVKIIKLATSRNLLFTSIG